MVVLGRIVAPYGIKGWVKVHPFGDDPLTWGEMPQWWLGTEPEGEAWHSRGVAELRLHGGTVVARLEGVTDRSGAEALTGMYVAAPREALPDAGEDAYYWTDLVGMAVSNLRGEPLGQVASLMETGAHAVLVVQEGERQRLIPFVAPMVDKVDAAKRTIRVDWERDW